jgi:hypothetical protein
MSRFRIFLRVDNGTWSRAQADTLPRRMLTVVAAFVLAAWNRFGSQGFLGPRSPARMVLTGLYGWLALTVLIWFIARQREPAVPGTEPFSLQRAAAAVTVAHFPLIILGFYIATFGAFIRNPLPGTVLAVVVFAVWMPALLGRAMQHLTDVETVTALGLVAVPYLLWLAWIGRYLYLQVGHLL